MGARSASVAVGLLLSGCEGTALVGDDFTPDSGTRRPCILEGDIVEDTILGDSFCSSYLVEIPIGIRNGATLTIAPGVELRFGRGAGLTIGGVSDGRLAIHGSPDLPVLLTSLAPRDDPSGRWEGIVFRGSTLPGSIIRHTIVENAKGGAGGCVTLESTAPDVVTLEGLHIEGCGGAGLWIDVPRLELLPPLSVTNAEFGISLAAHNVGRIDLPIQLEGVAANEIRGGTIAESATWIAQSVPWLVSGDIQVQATDTAVLALEPGVELRFAQSTWLLVGQGAPGAVAIRGSEDAPVILESDNPGGWHGVVLGAQTDSRTELTHAVLRGAGRRGEDVRGCLTIRGSTPISIVSSRFEACEQASIGAIDPRFRFAKLESNVFADSTVGLHVSARAVGSITSEQQYDRVLTNLMAGDELTKSAVWVRQSVPWTVDGSITVQGAEAPLLRLEHGVHLTFSPSSWLQIGSAEPGGLIAMGVSGDPVLLESSNPMAVRGSWRGILFGSNASSSRLERTMVRHGGQVELDAAGCVTVRGTTPRPIAIVRSTFDACAQAGIAALDGHFAFEALSDNTFSDSDAGLHLAASSVAGVTQPQTYRAVSFNRITGDPIDTDATWVPQPVPWVVRGTITVQGTNAPTFTLEAGLDLLFDDRALIEVGAGAPGTMIIAGTPQAPVVLASAQASPQPGDWVGLLFGPNTGVGTRAEYLWISHAGQPLIDVWGAITLRNTEARVRIASSQFAHNAQADIWIDCMSQPLLTGNLYGTLGVMYEVCM